MALCRGRVGLLTVAVGHRDAHATLAGSLLSISSSLHLLPAAGAWSRGLIAFLKIY